MNKTKRYEFIINVLCHRLYILAVYFCVFFFVFERVVVAF